MKYVVEMMQNENGGDLLFNILPAHQIWKTMKNLS